MKEYPRIRRLSTLGIVHHQGFDYEFNAFRTDFVGEGGAGKSMISDLLQLIFVGATAFHSPTKSTGGRKPNTMVLRTAGNSTDMAYAFLNIEVARNKFIVAGIYLESGNYSNLYIIQSGSSFSEEATLHPFDNLLGYIDFLKDDAIMPIQQFKDHIVSKRQLTCESWQYPTLYHKLLYKNFILPIDLSKSKRTLEIYAKIIQAFSREALEINKSPQLQQFLFGDDREKEFLKNFEAAVEELSGDVLQYEKNSDEIDKLTYKQQRLQQLLKQKKIRDTSFRTYTVNKYRYNKRQLEDKTLAIIKKIEDVVQSNTLLERLKTEGSTKLDILKTQTQGIDLEYSDTFKEKIVREAKQKKVDQFSKWIRHFNCTAEAMVQRLTKYHQAKESIAKITDFQNKLEQKKLLDFFDSNVFDDTSIVSAIRVILETLGTERTSKQRLLSLNNINDKNSLSHWALHLGRPLNRAEESIIHKFQNLGITVQDPTDPALKYLPEPKSLMVNLKISLQDNDGFWLDLNGVLEYIPLISNPIFNTTDLESIKQYFTQQSTTLTADIAGVEKAIESYSSLSEILSGYQNPDDYVSAWKKRGLIEDHSQEHEAFTIPLEGLDEYIELTRNTATVKLELENITGRFSTIESKKNKHHTLVENMGNELLNFTDFSDISEIQEFITKYNYNRERGYQWNDLEVVLSQSSNYYQDFKKLFESEKQRNAQVQTIKELDMEIAAAENTHRSLELEHSWISMETSDDAAGQDTLEISRASYQEAENEYTILYKVVAGEFLKNTHNRYEGSNDFMELCTAILPSELFDQSELLDEEITDRINKYLRDINQNNQSLNGRKLQKLSNIIEEVDTEVGAQLNDLRIIKNFFNEEDKTITGGHHVSIDPIFTNSFNREWMTQFTDQVNSDFSIDADNSLFQKSELSSQLEKYPALAEKMREAFYKCGGSTSFKPTTAQLLNPKSYYDLRFSMRSTNGKKNDGSTSQTYAAIALLCIARLSLIDRLHQNGKQRKGLRFMAIDEAEGLGTNFDMLYKIAKTYDYQLLSLSINPNKIDAANQNIYLLINSIENEDLNYEPVPVFGGINTNTI